MALPVAYLVFIFCLKDEINCLNYIVLNDNYIQKELFIWWHLICPLNTCPSHVRTDSFLSFEAQIHPIIVLNMCCGEHCSPQHLSVFLSLALFSFSWVYISSSSFKEFHRKPASGVLKLALTNPFISLGFFSFSFLFLFASMLCIPQDQNSKDAKWYSVKSLPPTGQFPSLKTPGILFICPQYYFMHM